MYGISLPATPTSSSSRIAATYLDLPPPRSFGCLAADQQHSHGRESSPTWNYSAIQVYGRATVFCDSRSTATETFLSKQIADLTKHAESTIMNYVGTAGGWPEQWEVSDAPSSFISILNKSIVGIEIAIDRLEGKHKMTQEMSEGDRNGVIAGFESLQTDDGSSMAKIVRERGAMKDAAREAAKAPAQETD